ncbi:hypothetical protein TNCV_810961 [Trichonephila clavipes]|uniref:Uncharacterized protein n=1 Tax=Trichonephila clavipes TaxID=2585209 RepID=A0A8X6VI54_TRICX|nr:hypothetical protein TNCV_810961 [Trichonephila clavipes]
MHSHFCLDVFGETILLLVKVPFAWCILKPAAGVGTAPAHYCRLDRGRSEVYFPLDINAEVSTLEYFPTRNYLTVETSLVPDGKWVFGEYRRDNI